jgi:hypothetical protein
MRGHERRFTIRNRGSTGIAHDRLKSVLPAAWSRDPPGARFAGANPLPRFLLSFPLQFLAALRIRRWFGRRVLGARTAANRDPGEAQHQEKPKHPDELRKLHRSFAIG